MNSSYSTQLNEMKAKRLLLAGPIIVDLDRGPLLVQCRALLDNVGLIFSDLFMVSYVQLHNWFLFTQIFPLERKQDSHYHGVADGEIDNRYRMPTTTLNSCFYYGLMVYVQCDKP